LVHGRISVFRYGIGDVKYFILGGGYDDSVLYFGLPHHRQIGYFFNVEINILPFSVFPFFFVTSRFTLPTHPFEIGMIPLESYPGKIDFDEYWSLFFKNKDVFSDKYFGNIQLVFLDANSTQNGSLEDVNDLIDTSIKTILVTNRILYSNDYEVMLPSTKLFRIISIHRPKIVAMRSGIVDFALLHNCQVTCIFANRREYEMFNFDDHKNVIQVVSIIND
jgi:hypothetical protein